MNQRDAATISEALRASLEVAPSSWHVAKINAALKLVEAFEQPWEIRFYIDSPDHGVHKTTFRVKNLKEARALILARLEPWDSVRIYSRLGFGKLAELWRKDQEGRPYRSV